MQSHHENFSQRWRLSCPLLVRRWERFPHFRMMSTRLANVFIQTYKFLFAKFSTSLFFLYASLFLILEFSLLQKTHLLLDPVKRGPGWSVVPWFPEGCTDFPLDFLKFLDTKKINHGFWVLYDTSINTHHWEKLLEAGLIVGLCHERSHIVVVRAVTIFICKHLCTRYWGSWVFHGALHYCASFLVGQPGKPKTNTY